MFMQTWKQINSFRLFVVVGLSLVTSAALFANDAHLTASEVLNAGLQAAIAAFAFLQCPELAEKKKEQIK